MAYHLAPALEQLRAEVNRTWPDRDTLSDGWVGDTSHAARRSDHNPDYAAGGVVRALDIDRDGIDPDRLVDAACADPRTEYTIFNRRIRTRSSGFRSVLYYGPNPHDKHVHISIRHGRGWEASMVPWLGASLVSRPGLGLPGITIPTVGALPAPLEDDMFDDTDRRVLTELAAQVKVLGVANGFRFASEGTVYYANLSTGAFAAVRDPEFHGLLIGFEPDVVEVNPRQRDIIRATCADVARSIMLPEG